MLGVFHNASINCGQLGCKGQREQWPAHPRIVRGRGAPLREGDVLIVLAEDDDTYRPAPQPLRTTADVQKCPHRYTAAPTSRPPNLPMCVAGGGGEGVLAG